MKSASLQTLLRALPHNSPFCSPRSVQSFSAERGLGPAREGSARERTTKKTTRTHRNGDELSRKKGGVKEDGLGRLLCGAFLRTVCGENAALFSSRDAPRQRYNIRDVNGRK